MNKQLLTAFFLLLITLVVSTKAIAQVKVEKEFDVREAAVPVNAQRFINSLPFKTKTSWFYEIGRYETSYEAKFKHKRKVYSVEFDTTGKLLDVEIEQKWKDITKATSTKIKEYLSTEFEEHKINKIQLQLIGADEPILNALKVDIKKMSKDLLQGYEVVVNGKKDGAFQLYEIFFDMSGIKQSIAQIKQRNTDHLEY